MAQRTTPVTQAEIAAFEKFFEQHPEINLPGNGKIFADYMYDTWGVEVTESTLTAALEQLRPYLEVMTPIQIRYQQAARQDMDRANKLYEWITGPQHTLVKTGDEALANVTVLLGELRGREITTSTIFEAINRAGYSKGLHYAPLKLQPDPRRHEDDGTSFAPKQQRSKYRPDGKIDHGFEEATKPAPAVPQQTPDAWKTLAENLRGASHSDDAVLKSINGSSWRETYTLRKRYLARREGSVFNKTAV